MNLTEYASLGERGKYENACPVSSQRHNTHSGGHFIAGDDSIFIVCVVLEKYLSMT